MTPAGNNKSRILWIAVATAAILAMGAVLAQKAVLAPLEGKKARQQELQKQLDQLSRENRKKASYEAQLKALACRMLSGNENQAGEHLSAEVLNLLEPAHLGGKLNAQPVSTPALVGNSFREIAQTITVRGRLDRIVDYLYLLDSQPFVHRLDNLSMKRDAASGDVELTARYGTLIFDSVKGGRPATTQSATSASPVQDLATDKRRQYAAIEQRDLFRPYVQKIAAVTPNPSPDQGRRPTPPPEPRKAEYKLVGLPAWGEKDDDIVLRNSVNREIRHYKPGDKLPGNIEIVMVDYRELPRPDRPLLLSYSRMILRIGQEYWAVELGQHLSDRRRLTGEQLPPDLPAATTMPADGGDRREPDKAKVKVDPSDIVLK